MGNFILIEARSNGRVIEYPLTQGQAVLARPGATYTLLDQTTQQLPEGLVLKRDGEDLDLVVDQISVAHVSDFYANDTDAIFSVDGSTAPSDNMTIDHTSAAATGADGDIVWQASDASEGGYAQWIWGGSALALGGIVVAASKGDGGSNDVVVNNEEVVVNNTDFVVTLSAAAGPLVSTLTVQLFDKDGNLLATAEHDFLTGPVSFTITNGYTGPIFAQVIDSNGAGADFLDEASNTLISLGEPLRAMGNADGADVALSVTPLTELAVRVAGITDNKVSAADLAVNDQVAALFGVDDILGPVITVLEDDFDNADGVNAAEQYGQALAILSGVDSNTGSMEATLDQLQAAISDQGDGNLALDAVALNLLTDGVTAFEAGANSGAADLDDNAVPQLATDTTAPIINTLLVSTDDVINNTDTLTAVGFNGTTSGVEDGQVITVVIGGVSNTATVTNNVFNGTADLSAVGDGASIAVTADVTDFAGNAATQFSGTVSKDTDAPSIDTLLVSTDDVVTSSDTQNAVAFNGTTSGVEDGQTVTVVVGGVSATATVTSNVFNATVNLAAVADNANLAVTADVSDVAGNAATQFTNTIVKDVTAPTIDTLLVSTDDIVNSSDTLATVAFNGTTSGVEDGQVITVVIGGQTITPTVTSNAFSGTVNLSAVGDNTSLAVTADVSDAVGNAATQFSNTIVKDVSAPVITVLVSADNAVNANDTQTAVVFTGTTTGVEDGQVVNVVIAGVAATATVTSNVFDGTVDLSAVGDSASLAVTGDVSDAAGNAATQFTGTFAKDVIAPTIDTLVVSADDVVDNSDTLTAVAFAGTTTGVEDGQVISVSIGGVNATATVTANAFSGTANLSAVVDNNSIAVTADVSDAADNAATQFSSTISKNVTPTIDTLLVSFNDVVNSSDTLTAVVFDGSTSGAEDGQVLTVVVGGQSATATVNSNAFNGTVDLSAVGDSASIAVTADVDDVDGNPAPQFTNTIVKDVIAPTIDTLLVSTDDVVNSSDTQNAVAFAGTTSGVEDGQTINVSIGGEAATATVIGNAFSGTVDLSAVGDSASLAVSADVSDAAGNAATQFTSTIIKDVTAPTIDTLLVSTDDVVNSSDTQNAVAFAGTTSGVEDGQVITVVIGGVTVTPTVTSNAFSGTVDLSAVGDNAALAVTADVSDAVGNAATQFTNTIVKDIAAPSIDTLLVSTDDVVNGSDTQNAVAFAGTTSGVEDGQVITVTVGGQTVTPTVTSNAFSGTVDLSAVGDSASIAVTGDVSDAAGNAASQFTSTIVKDTSAPSIDTLLVSTDDVVTSADTQNAVVFNGTTSGVEDGQTLTVIIGGVTATATVTANAFSGTADLSAVGDNATLAVTGDVSDVAGNAASQFTNLIVKDTTASIDTLLVSTDDIVNASDTLNAVVFNGTTTGVDDGQTVIVVIAGVTVTPTVTSNAFSGTVDLSAVGDNNSLAVTADVSDVQGNVATQFTSTIVKDVVLPSVVISDDTAGTATGDVLYTFTFSEAVTGFVAGDVVVTGGAAGTFSAVSTTVFTLVVAPTANSTTNITVDVAADVAADAAGNNNTVAAQSVQAVDTTVSQDTTKVVFDLLQGLSSDHSLQTFSAGVDYDIFILVDSNASGVFLASGQTWDGGANLGAGDTITLVGTGSAVITRNNQAVSNTKITATGLVWSNTVPSFALGFALGFIGTYTRSFNLVGDSGGDNINVWTGSAGLAAMRPALFITDFVGNTLSTQGL